jgi:c-di-GMP-binding flagellar brake protein YcgR
MPYTKRRLERRKRKRFRVQNDTFVVLISNETRVGPLRDIAMDGLAFHYTGREEPLNKSAKLGVFSVNHDLFLYKVPCKIISDSKIYARHPSPITKRRCGVQFSELTEDQRSELKCFIANHTAGEA